MIRLSRSVLLAWAALLPVVGFTFDAGAQTLAEDPDKIAEDQVDAVDTPPAREPKPAIEEMVVTAQRKSCLLYTSPSPRDKRQSRMPSSA